ncbi:16S rRNA (uracil(1498)-N(3))-methyltransferase [Leptobacterium flavescens]|uniref:Ribosomal RNA small subunit methyltransferase E n=1 Tax=Leptobacterium flavescens TaxID=472055 RepID=A0A6P0UT35_9FLAO|nr:16S rRNA (uracil(1498)-N(3))-methyltransferase [Leptobacterium flavescens]NER14013.1 16S rRNA (uracil(1498)-N(3))-methyltransferase [Leptobacterium flavescens]
MQLFYNPAIDPSTRTYTFDREESKHIIKVLRKKEGDIIHITNGQGWLFKAEVQIADIKKCIVNITDSELQPPSKYKLHMAVAPTKMNERYEWFLEKATEIGIHEITPVICKHSERKQIKASRFERILQSAMKQSLSCYLPKLNEAIPLAQFLSQENGNEKLFIAHCEETERTNLKDTLKAEEDSLILIGPEGDFSKDEIELAKKNGFLPLMLGETRLRTETAAVVACHSVAFINL